jgi:hypothetical protein
MKPAIIVTVYDRCQHLEQCLESLERCKGSESFHVIVGSDAAFKEEHEERIRLVRGYLQRKEKGHNFKKLSVLYHDGNMGENINGSECHSYAKSYGHDRFIAMEDDVIVGLYFLKFMDDALTAYSNDPNLIAVNGYLDHDLIEEKTNPFLYNRFSAYGYGSWYEKWDLVQAKRDSINYSARMLLDVARFRKVAKFTPNAKSYPFLAKNLYRAADIEIGLMMEFEHLWVLKPPFSLTANRGMDGSGLRSGVNAGLQAMIASDNPIDVPSSSELESVRFENVKPRIEIKYIVENWLSFLIYNYIPFGFSVLLKLRSLKKSL